VPELPDITMYLERLQPLLGGEMLERIDLFNPFVLRSVAPTVGEVEGSRVTTLRRIGKRIALGMDNDTFVVIHLMIAGRLRWRPPGKKIGGKLALAGFVFPHGTLFLTEAGTTRRASIHLVRSAEGLAEFDRG